MIRCCFQMTFFRGMQNGSDGKDKAPPKRLPSIKRLSVTPRLPVTTSNSGGNSGNASTPTTPDAPPPNKPPSATAATAVKKSFVPNLSSTRNVPPIPKLEGANEAEGNISRSKRFAGERRQWRERPKKEFIQTSSVFSDGVASQQMGGVTRSGLPVATGAPTDAAAACGSKSGLKAEVVQEDSIDDILNAPFISDLKNEQSPLSLVEDKLNSCQLTAAHKTHGAVSDEAASEMQEKLYILQFPSLLPLSAAAQLEQTVAPEETNADAKECTAPEDVPEKAFSIKDLPEGKIGSFEILENGEMRLVFGHSGQNQVVLECNSGFESTAAMSLVHHDSVAQTVRHLADVHTKLVCCPDFTDLLKKSESSDCSSSSSEAENNDSNGKTIDAEFQFQEIGS